MTGSFAESRDTKWAFFLTVVSLLMSDVTWPWLRRKQVVPRRNISRASPEDLTCDSTRVDVQHGMAITGWLCGRTVRRLDSDSCTRQHWQTQLMLANLNLCLSFSSTTIYGNLYTNLRRSHGCLLLWLTVCVCVCECVCMSDTRFIQFVLSAVTLCTSTHRHYNESVHRKEQHASGNNTNP